MLWARDLVPLLSYWVLRGRCRFCEARIPLKLFTVEALAVSTTFVTLAIVEPGDRVAGVLLAWGLLALSWFDYEHGRLPNFLTLPLGVAGIAVAVISNVALLDHLLGVVFGFVILTGIAFTYKRFRGYDGLGGGDVKMFAAIGAWVGWQGLPIVLLSASLSALVFCLMRGRPAAGASVRFGPFIAAAGWTVWVLYQAGVSL
jgi:leader peptidase (prepilin peptidase)/N-methyltransferase